MSNVPRFPVPRYRILCVTLSTFPFSAKRNSTASRNFRNSKSVKNVVAFSIRNALSRVAAFFVYSKDFYVGNFQIFDAVPACIFGDSRTQMQKNMTAYSVFRLYQDWQEERRAHGKNLHRQSHRRPQRWSYRWLRRSRSGKSLHFVVRRCVLTSFGIEKIWPKLLWSTKFTTIFFVQNESVPNSRFEVH